MFEIKGNDLVYRLYKQLYSNSKTCLKKNLQYTTNVIKKKNTFPYPSGKVGKLFNENKCFKVSRVKITYTRKKVFMC